MEENEFRYIRDDVTIYADKIANEFDPSLEKLLIISFINNKNKIKNKIEKEMLHYRNSNFEYALIVLNCKYFMYKSLFSDCKDVLRDIGLSHKSLIGVVIVYRKNTTDDNGHSLTPNVLIKNPYCSYQPFQITDNFKTDFNKNPNRIHFKMSKDIISFDASGLFYKIKKFMIKNKYWDEDIEPIEFGFGSNKPVKITYNNKEIQFKKFEKPRCDKI
ncbi:MAG: hypothetical protein O8C62_12435 [Candidatus Methanoperedens sp.]|nr:hypothetical protein [Candidatus Methanoperedens sp.]